MRPDRFEYSVYGLAVSSNREMEGLRPACGSGVPLEVDFAGLGDVLAPSAAPHSMAGLEAIWHLSKDAWLVRYSGQGAAAPPWSIELRDGGARLTVRWSAPFQLLDIPTFLPGAGFAAALQLRGALTLHASAVAMAGKAVLIMGASGAGKSTTAAALVRRGFPLISDDVAVLDAAGLSLDVEVGPKRLRIHPETGRAAGWTEELPRLFHHPILGDKRYIELSAAERESARLPIGAIYILQPRIEAGSREAIAPLPQHLAAASLISNIYRARFLDRERALEAAGQCTWLASAVPIRAVTAVDELALLPRLIDSIATDVANCCLPRGRCDAESPSASGDPRVGRRTVVGAVPPIL